MSRGAIRRGEALLAGLLRCARCGQKLHVRYSDGASRYQCVGAFNQVAAAKCIIFSGNRPDRMVSKEVIDRLQPCEIFAVAVISTFSTASTLSGSRCPGRACFERIEERRQRAGSPDDPRARSLGWWADIRRGNGWSA
jgi:hypothetical protein